MRNRWVLLCSVTAWTTPVAAQTLPPVAPDETQADIVVTGTRSAGRRADESPAPVDVYEAGDLDDRGLSDVNRTLQYLSPSFNYPRTSTAPSAANTRPVTLRGLWPDQTLVLVNGKRWHTTSVLTFNNGIGRGSAGVDLNTIPVSAIERVEVLRDGAAAQYGSDAIAGVIDIKLKDGDDPGFASVQSGITQRGDGANLISAVTHGFALGKATLTLTAEARDRSPTQRAAIDSRFNRVTGQQGDPDSTDGNVAASLRVPLGAVELYADAIYDHRRSVSPALYRAPNVSPLYPSGFVPQIRLDLNDAGGTIGIRGELAGWRWDISDTPGYNRARFEVFDTVNTSLGAASPTRFDAGGANYFQNVANFDLSRKLDLLAGVNLAGGVEYRYESYEIVRGEPASYAGAGAQGFPGYNPPIPVDADRDAWSFYGDVEASIVRGVDLGLAARHERYSDFGNATTGKASLFVKPVDAVALRGTISSGFRAPALIQQFFSTITSQLSGGALVNIGTFAVADPTAAALGATPLRRERARNISGGIVLTPARSLTITADYFNIRIKDRIALSDTLSGPAVLAVLRAASITNASQARFFTNALDTTTEGFEVVARWSHPLGDARLDLNASYGRYETEIDRLATNPTLPTIPLLGTLALQLLTTAQPEDKLILGANVDADAWSLHADLVRFGRFEAVQLAGSQVYDARTSIDLTGEFRVADRFRLGLGVLNLTDVFPEKIADRALAIGGTIQYPEAGGLGSNGREFYARVTVDF